MSWLAIKTVFGAVPGWIYAGLVVLILVAVGALHLIGQRNEAREALATAQQEIIRLNRDLSTAQNNVTLLERSVNDQNDALDKLALDAKARQDAAAAQLALAKRESGNAQARIKALQAIQQSNVGTKGADRAIDAWRNQP